VRTRIRERLRDSARAFAVSARNPGLRRAQLSFGATWTAEWAFTVALGVVAFRDGGPTAVGVVAFVRMAPSALLAPIGTTLADRFPRDRVLMWSCIIRSVAMAAAAVFLAGGGTRVPVYALAVVGTAAFTVFRPAHSALLPELCTTPLELTSANVVRGLLDSLSTLLGPLVAALILDVGSPEAVFALVAALSFVSGILLLGLAYESPPRAAALPLSRIAHEAAEGFGALRSHHDAALLIGLALVASLTRGFLRVFAVVIALELLGIGAPGVGLVTAAVGAGAVAGSLGASALVSGRHLAALEGVGVALWGLPLVLSGALPHEWVVLGLMGVIGVGNALADIGLYTLPARLVPDELLARVFGAKESLTAMSVALGALTAPLVIDLFGVRGALVALGLIAPALAALAWKRLRAIDGRVAHRDAEIAVLQRVGMLRPLSIPAIENLAVHIDRLRVAPGREVFRQGEHGDRFYVIEDGEAEVIGDGRFIRTLSGGDGFGEIALLRDTVRTTTVRARTPLLVYSLDRHHFVPAVSGYSSSSYEADALVHDRLATFKPGRGPGR
jgi:MFS family permease